MRTLTILTVALSAGALLSGCAAAQRAMPGTLSNANVVAVLNTIDTSEIEAAQLAKQKASSQAVRTYAGRLVDEHTDMMQKNLQLARRIKVEPEKPRLASALESTHQQTMEQLRKRSGQDFDRAYMTYQVQMHEQALKLVEDTAESADDSRLKQHLIQARPELQSHLSAAQNLQRQLVAHQ